jgi:hypothetical protein
LLLGSAFATTAACGSRTGIVSLIMVDADTPDATSSSSSGGSGSGSGSSSSSGGLGSTDSGMDAGEGDGGEDTGSSCFAADGQCLVSDSVCAVPASLACPSAPFALFCCLQVAGSCGQPGVTTLSGCDAGAPSCQGTPAPPDLNGIPADADLGPDEPDAWFPMGCTFTYPVCGNLGVYTCTCGSGWDCKP